MMAYIIKSGIMLSLFYLFFILFMKKTTFFRFNRMMLLAGSVLCMILPLLDVSFLSGTAIADMPHITLPEASALGETSEKSGIWNWFAVLSVLYFTGAAIVVICCIVSIIRTFSICRKGSIIRQDGVSVTISEEPMTSFSFFRHIVMSREDYEHNPVIIQHEMMHVECLHSVDILFFSIITALHWFNPLVWLARNELKEVQEYEADEAVLKQGIDATQYQLLLVKKAVGAEHFRMANGFNHSKLKNRIKMMQTKKTNKLARLAYLACIPILLGTLCFCTDQNKDKSGTSDKDSTSNEEIIPFQLLDETPKFNGEDANAFAKWVSEQLVYPESAKEAGTGGRVYVSFVIDENGNITDVKTIKSISEDLDNEAIRVVSSSPAWEPGKKDGRTVKVTYTLPVIFELR